MQEIEATSQSEQPAESGAGRPSIGGSPPALPGQPNRGPGGGGEPVPLPRTNGGTEAASPAYILRPWPDRAAVPEFGRREGICAGRRPRRPGRAVGSPDAAGATGRASELLPGSAAVLGADMKRCHTLSGEALVELASRGGKHAQDLL